MRYAKTLAKAAGAALALTVFMSAPADAASFTLTDSLGPFNVKGTVLFNTGNGTEGSSMDGLYDLSYNGSLRLSQQSFFMRRLADNDRFDGGVVNWDGSGNAIDGGSDDEVTVGYASPNLAIEVDYTTLSAVPNGGVLNEAVAITNVSGVARQFSLFMFVDWDLPPALGADDVVFTPGVGLGGQDNFFQTDVEVGGGVATINTARVDVDNSFASGLVATRYEVGDRDALLAKLEGTSMDLANLTSVPGAYTSPTNTAYAYQWQFNLAAQDTALINISKGFQTSVEIVPEPGSIFLLATGLAGVVARRRKQAA